MADWRPSAERTALEARAALLSQLRAFFQSRRVLEVETPLLCTSGVTDSAIEPLIVPTSPTLRYLQTSPEYAMKRLLAAGSGDIFQICKAFRAGEYGRKHNPEYTILEWYRLSFDHHAMIREVAELLGELLPHRGWQIWSWAALFQHILEVDGHVATLAELNAVASDRLGNIPDGLDRDALLDLLFTHCVEPALASWGIVFVVDYPASQAALARLLHDRSPLVGARFECYVDGVELANGYWECIDPGELERRFQQDNQRREVAGLEVRPIDPLFLAAMTSGVPPCSGVALGVDRLLALRLGAGSLADVLSFDWERC